MTKRDGKAETIDIKGLLAGDGDFVRAGLEALLQAALEAEMTEEIGAAKGERTETRVSYRSGYYNRSLITRVGTLELRVPQSLPRRKPGIDWAGFRPICSPVINARRRLWLARWRRCTCRGCRHANACPGEGRGKGGDRGAVRASVFGLVDQYDQQVAG